MFQTQFRHKCGGKTHKLTIQIVAFIKHIEMRSEKSWERKLRQRKMKISTMMEKIARNFANCAFLCSALTDDHQNKMTKHIKRICEVTPTFDKILIISRFINQRNQFRFHQYSGWIFFLIVITINKLTIKHQTHLFE